MFKARSIQSSLSIKDKILSIDYTLVFTIFILGIEHSAILYCGGEFSILVIFSVSLFFLACF